MNNEEYWEKLAQELLEAQQQIIKSRWAIGYRDRGLGHGDYAVVVEDDGKAPAKVVVECDSKLIAEHIIEIHNEGLTNANSIKRKKD